MLIKQFGVLLQPIIIDPNVYMLITSKTIVETLNNTTTNIYNVHSGRKTRISNPLTKLVVLMVCNVRNAMDGRKDNIIQWSIASQNKTNSEERRSLKASLLAQMGPRIKLSLLMERILKVMM